MSKQPAGPAAEYSAISPPTMADIRPLTLLVAAPPLVACEGALAQEQPLVIAD